MSSDELDMDADEYVVIAPYITPKVKDLSGAFIVRGYLEGGVIKRDDIDPASLKHHLESGLVAAKGSDAAKYAAPSGTPKPGEPPNVPVTETPVATLPLADRLAAQAKAGEAKPEQLKPKAKPDTATTSSASTSSG